VCVCVCAVRVRFLLTGIICDYLRFPLNVPHFSLFVPLVLVPPFLYSLYLSYSFPSFSLFPLSLSLPSLPEELACHV